jgi:hypothetical protein
MFQDYDAKKYIKRGEMENVMKRSKYMLIIMEYFGPKLF